MDMLVGILMDSMGSSMACGRSEEFGRKNVISFVLIRNYACQVHGYRERKRGR